MQGEQYINNPQYNPQSDEYSIFVGCPIEVDGESVGAITVTFSSSYLSDLVAQLNTTSIGEASLINEMGTVIANQNHELVENAYNYITAADEDSSLMPTANVYKKILELKSGREKYTNENGQKMNLFFSEVENTSGWRFISTMTNSELYSSLFRALTFLSILIVFSCIYIGIISRLMGKKVGKRVSEIGENLKIMADGDFTLSLPHADQNGDEIEQAQYSMQTMVTNLKDLLNGVKDLAMEMEDKGAVLESTASQMKEGAEAISTSINEISIGNTEQSNEINHVYTQMEEFKLSMQEVSDHMSSMNKIAEATNDSLTNGKENMTVLTDVFASYIGKFEEYNSIVQNMTASMANINKITASIQEIAGQTNLLALNAAIEAARVGEAGKGFSVVADEIRNLSEQSAVSVKEINEVINNVNTEGKRLIDSSHEMKEQLSTQRNSIENTVVSFQNLSEDIEKMIPMIETVYQLNLHALKGADNVGESIENANAISEELASTSEQVAVTGNHFAESSVSVSEISDAMQELTQKLANALEQFNLGDKTNK